MSDRRRERATHLDDEETGLPKPTTEDVAESLTQEHLRERLLEDTRELLELWKRANDVFAEQSLDRFASFSELLDAVLPRSADAEERIGRAIQLSSLTVRGLRSGEFAPWDVEAERVVLLAQAVGLDRSILDTLLTREADRRRICQDESQLTRAESVAWSSVLEEFHEAWRKIERDGPRGQ